MKDLIYSKISGFPCRKATGFLTAALLLLSANLSAQESDYTPLAGELDFLAVNNNKIDLSTSHVLVNNQITVWEEKSLRAGLQFFEIEIFSCKDIPKPFTAPENPSFVCEIKDMEGNLINQEETDMSHIFRLIKSLKKYRGRQAARLAVMRGGKYRLTASIEPDLYFYETEMILPDEAGMRVDDYMVEANSVLCPTVTLTSGYPYEPSEFAGEKYLHWKVTPVGSPETVVAEETETFELKSEMPTLAAIASLELPAGELAPGEYLYTLTSDYTPANTTFIATVIEPQEVSAPAITTDKVVKYYNLFGVEVDASYRGVVITSDGRRILR